MTRKTWFLSVAVLLFSFPVIASANPVVNYLRDRLYDVMDLVTIRIMAPHDLHGIGAKARVTSLAQVGWVNFEGEGFGLDRRATGYVKEKRVEGGLSIFYYSNIETDAILGNQFLDPDSAWSKAAPRGIVRNDIQADDQRGHFLSIGAEVETPILGLDLGVYPYEAVDLVLGIVGIDAPNDDLTRVDRQAASMVDYEVHEEAEKAHTIPDDSTESATIEKPKKVEMKDTYQNFEKQFDSSGKK